MSLGEDRHGNGNDDPMTVDFDESYLRELEDLTRPPPLDISPLRTYTGGPQPPSNFDDHTASPDAADLPKRLDKEHQYHFSYDTYLAQHPIIDLLAIIEKAG